MITHDVLAWTTTKESEYVVKIVFIIQTFEFGIYMQQALPVKGDEVFMIFVLN